MPEGRDVEYEIDGTVMRGHFALPVGAGPWPGVLIAHEANGLDDHQRGRAERLAELGYAALAMDYHGYGKVFTDNEAMMARIGALGADPGRLRNIGQAALNTLVDQPKVDPTRIAAIGYCFGGTLVLELARLGVDIKAVVGFHPGLVSARPEDSVRISAKVLVCVGAEDPIVTAEQRDAFMEDMHTAGVDWQMHVYGGVKHSFTHPNAAHSGLPGLEYNQDADRRSWQAMLDLFQEALVSPE